MNVRWTLRIFLLFAPLIGGVMFISELVITNQLAALGAELVTLERDISTLKDENRDLSQKIASASSLTIITEAAKSRGFTKPATEISLTADDLPVALKPLE